MSPNPDPGRALRVEPYAFFDPDSEEERTLWDVQAPSPESVKEAWGTYYLIARYNNREAAEEHARTRRKPPGYG